MRTTGAVAGLAAALAAGAAAGQPAAADAIGARLQQPPPDAEAPAAPPAAEQVDPTDAVPLVPPAPPLAGPAYESRIRASMSSAEAFQGPLDGGWRMTAPSGALYDFQLVDRGAGAVEGAWRDLRRPGALTASGLVDAIERDGAAVRMRFDGARVATLRPGPDGRWVGELEEAGRRLEVSLARRDP